MKKTRKRRLALLLAGLMLFSSVFNGVSLNSFADDAPERTTIASYAVKSKEDVPETSPVGFSSVGLTLNGTEYMGFSSKNIAAKNIQPGAYWEFNIDASQYESIGFGMDTRITKQGPRDFVLEYSLDGSEEFTAIKTVSIPEGTATYTGSVSLDPSETAALGGHSFRLRYKVADGSIAIDGGSIAGGATWGINNIVFTGVKLGGGEPVVDPGVEEKVCSAVYVVDGKTTVKAGETVSLACDTEGASVYFNSNGTDNFSLYESPIVINEDTVIKAFATAEGYKDSEVSSFTVKVEVTEPVTEPEVTLPFKDGDTVAIVVSDMAINETAISGKYLGGSAVTKDGETTVIPSDAAVYKVVVSDDGVAFLNVNTNKYLASTEKGGTLIHQDELNAGALWILEQEEGGWLLKVSASKDTAKPQYIEWYASKGNFTTYGYKESSKSAYLANFYPATASSSDVTGNEPDVTDNDPVEEPENGLPFKDGDVVALVTADTALNANVVSGKYLGGTPVTKDGDNVVLPSDAVAHKVIVTEEGVAFVNIDNNKYLASTEKGGTLVYQDELNTGALWILEKEEGGWLLKVAASKDATRPQYLEWNSKYKDFTTYGYNEKYKSDYLTNFYAVKITYKVDTDTVLDVAKWGGGAILESDVRVVYADLFDSNDCLDTAKEFTAVVNGNAVVPFTSTKSTNTGSTNYYMGATGLGTGSDDYMQLKLSTKGYGAMKMSFRLRSSNTAPGEFTLKYSVNGTDFYDFTTGSCSYVVYNVGEKTADIKDGVAKASLNAAAYVSFNFDVPEGAENADELIIRFVPGTTAAKAGNEIKTGGVVRIDSVEITGSPIVSSDLCGYVKVSPKAGNIALGSSLTMTSDTKDAAIYYSVNGGEFVQYNAESKPVVDTLPAVVRVYASNGTLADSIVITNYYTQTKCEAVTAKPNGGAVVLNEKVKFTALTEGADILYRFSDSEVWLKYTEPVKITELPCQIYVKSVKEGCIDSEVKTLNFTEKTNEKYNIYFGQLHSHTQFSDGAGSCEEAFDHATKVANLDFLAVTDHSNSLDHESESKIDTNVDTAETDEWTLGHALAKKYSSDTFTCIYGYEMTWSNGLGHMNTYNTPGFQSRTQKAYTTYSTALNNYYSALETVPDSISMFNHPGTTFGDFQDFAYYTPARDELINLIEVGNGEGAIGSSGYFPSYEYYTRALDKGWHIAPTNNQDNHKGLWGDANTARSVVLASANTEEEIYQAMKDKRMYATEDNNLSIYYTLDGHILGTVLDKEDVGEEVELKVELSDPDRESIGTVEVIVNGGLSVASKVVNGSEETVTFKVPSTYSYYYIKVTQGDKDIAVTAPVWVGEVEACGINSVSTETTLPVKGENIDINIDFFNNETTDLEVNEITIDVLDAESTLTRVATLTGDDLANVAAVKPNSTASVTFNYVYGSAGKITYIVNASAKLAGADKLYTGKLTVNYAAPEMVGEVLIDASHSNDYVAGYYMNNVNNLISMCAKHNLRATLIKDSVSASDLAGAKLLVISSAGLDDTKNNPPLYSHKTFEPEFIEAVREYVANGGSVILCGIADYNNYQAATQTNALLEGIGSTIRINSDEVMDDTHNGGQTYRLYPENFNMDSPFMKGVASVEANPDKFQVYSQYSGCSVDVSNAVENDVVYAAEKLVWGFDTTYSVDCKDDNGTKLTDADGNANIKNDNMGDVTFLAHQKTKAGGDIFVAGGVFCSDFEVKAEIDNNDSLPYANATIVENILERNEVALKVSTVKEARQGNTGDVFCVEGYVTSGTANPDTTFFDTIYVQDETGGIDIFPYAEAGLELGTKVRIVGYVSSYQGDLELKVITVKILPDEKKVIEPTVLSTKDAMDYDVHGGELVKTEGTVTRVLIENGSLSEFWLKDATGHEAAIFIDGYIYSGTTGENKLAGVVKEGAVVSAVGVLYMHPEGNSDVSVPVLRVRNCDEIVVTAQKPSSGSSAGAPSSSGTASSGSSSGQGTPAGGNSNTDTASQTPATEVPGRVTPGNRPNAGTSEATTQDTVTEEKAETPDAEAGEAKDTTEQAAEENTQQSVSVEDSETALAAAPDAISAEKSFPVAAVVVVVVLLSLAGAAGAVWYFKFRHIVK